MTKSYHQYCPVAHALDLVGERWALLVVRELQHGPLRYSDLHARIGGCSTNMLAARLRDLEAGGVVQKRKLPPPAASTGYELTETGEGLRPVLAALARWGARTLGPPADDVELIPGWLERVLHTAVAPLVTDVRIGFRCGTEAASVIDGNVRPGVDADAEAVVQCDPSGFYHLMVEGALEAVAITGNRKVVERLAETIAGKTVSA